jgi:LysM repeat protein
MLLVCCALALWMAGSGSIHASTHSQSFGTRGQSTTMHVVQWGDTIWGIARSHGSSVGAIMRANGLRSDRIYVGQRLTIPFASGRVPTPQRPGREVVVVRWGDTLWGIAQRYGTTVSALMRANRLHSYRIFVGQRLVIPVGSPPVIPTPVPQLPEVILAPWTGPPGTWVDMRIVGFPAWDTAQVSIGPYGSELTPVGSVRINGAGTAVTRVRADAGMGMNLVIAARTSGAGWAGPIYASAMFRVR